MLGKSRHKITVTITGGSLVHQLPFKESEAGLVVNHAHGLVAV